MQATSSAPSINPAAVPPSVDDALNSSTWFQQQRYWEETTRVQTQLLALLQKQQTKTTTATEGKQRRPRRNSVSPVSQSTFKKTNATPVSSFPVAEPVVRRRGSWSSSLAAAQSAAILGLTDEAAAVSAMQLLALANDIRHTNNTKKESKRAQGCTSPFGKAKEAEPYGSFDEDVGDLQPHPDFYATSPSSSSASPQHQPMPERKNIMSISALLN